MICRDQIPLLIIAEMSSPLNDIDTLIQPASIDVQQEVRRIFLSQPGPEGHGSVIVGKKLPLLVRTPVPGPLDHTVANFGTAAIDIQAETGIQYGADFVIASAQGLQGPLLIVAVIETPLDDIRTLLQPAWADAVSLPETESFSVKLVLLNQELK